MAKAFSERPAWQRGAIIGGWSLLALVVLVQCSGSASDDSDAFTGDLVKLPGTSNFAGTIAEGATKEVLTAAAQAQCEGETICQVLGWPAHAKPASAFPMLPREVATLDFSYSLNRNSGFERSLFDCDRFPGKPEECLSVRDVVGEE